MKTGMRIAFGLAIFLAVAALVYWVTSDEWRGSMLLAVDAAAFAYVGLVFRGAVRRAAVPATPEAMAAEELPVQEAHVGPSIWPFVASIGAVLLVIGAVGEHWVVIPGVILFLGTIIGWLLDVEHQTHPGEVRAAHLDASAGERSPLEGQEHPEERDRE